MNPPHIPPTHRPVQVLLEVAAGATYMYRGGSMEEGSHMLLFNAACIMQVNREEGEARAGMAVEDWPYGKSWASQK